MTETEYFQKIKHINDLFIRSETSWDGGAVVMLGFLSMFIVFVIFGVACHANETFQLLAKENPVIGFATMLVAFFIGKVVNEFISNYPRIDRWNCP